jgi:hypothetical protein
LKRFPHAACGDTTLLLAEYLDEQGYGRAHYICGELGAQTHAWLELCGYVVDITADQFEDYAETRFVAQDMTWHGQFSIAERFTADWRLFDPYTQAMLAHTYLVIRARL